MVYIIELQNYKAERIEIKELFFSLVVICQSWLL